MNDSAAKTFKMLRFFFVIAAFSFFLASCGVTDYPHKPFVYNYKINILPKGKYSAEEEKVLKDQLDQQIHDSIRVRRQRKFLVVKVLKKPPVFDSANVSISERYMTTMLHTLGYLRDSINASYNIDTIENQYRTTVNFDVYPTQLFRMDSIWYNLKDSVPPLPSIDTLQQLTKNSLRETVIHKGDPFSQYLISSELDRIADLARNNGYLKFRKEELWAVWDTVGRSILTPTTDITEQLRQLEELRKKRENPTADIEIRLRSNVDTGRLTRYHVGEVTVYPDTDIDTTQNNKSNAKTEILTENLYRFISYRNLFKARKLTHFISLHRGDLYAQENYLKTQNRFSALPAWRLVTVNQLPRPGTDTVDFEILLVPAKQYTVGVNFDVSRNLGNSGSTFGYEGNLVGLGANFTLLNKNFARAANVATTNFRYGIELTSRIDSIQTQQFLLSHNIQFPRLVPKLRWLPIPQEQKDRASTFLSFNLGYTDRFKYYRLLTLSTSWAYEFSFKKTILGVRLFNLEYNVLERRAGLDTLIKHNQSYNYIFNDGFIPSTIINVTTTGGKKYVTNLLRLTYEQAGILTLPLLQKLVPDAKVYRFLKLDAELTQTRKVGGRRRNAIAWRTFGGVGFGLPYSNVQGNGINVYMPFFRQYYAGGPTSMRAWSVRKLGPGSTIKSFDRTVAPDRFGDMRLEANFEWRIYLAQFLGSYPLETALFTDMGNVWFLRKNPDFPNGEFNVNRLGKDLAIGVGTGFRIDFGFLLARFDFAWKAKDPSPEDPAAQNKWFYHWRPGFKSRYGAQFQLGINYPF